MAYGNRAPGEAGLSAAVSALEVTVKQNTEGTGWRNIASLVTGGATVAGLKIIRIGPIVYLRILDLRGNAGTSAGINFVTGLPVGWRPADGLYERPLGTRIVTVGNPVTSVTATSDQITIGNAGSFGCNGDIDTSDTSWLEVRWVASGNFPTTNLPGTAI